MSRREREWVDWIRARAGSLPGLLRGIGDDAAVLEVGNRGPIVLACDQCLESVHFEPGVDPWELVGRKALARVLSDMAAMAARPWAALVSVSVPEGDDALLEALMGGLLEAAAREQTAVVGGDMARSPRGVSLDVTVLGLLEGREAWGRDGARPGDELWVSGELGGTRAGHHLRFVPRWREALALHATGAVNSAIDLSDGLAQDLPRLCEASGVGAVLRLSDLPRRTDSEGRRCSIEAALGDGEDFELLLAVAPGRGPELQAACEVKLTRIGEIQLEGLDAVSADGVVQPLRRGGYEHF